MVTDLILSCPLNASLSIEVTWYSTVTVGALAVFGFVALAALTDAIDRIADGDGLLAVEAVVGVVADGFVLDGFVEDGFVVDGFVVDGLVAGFEVEGFVPEALVGDEGDVATVF